MPPNNPIAALSERVTALEATVGTLSTRVTSLEATLSELNTLVESLKQNQMKWAPPFRFSMPPLQL
jgi:phage shock protein A